MTTRLPPPHPARAALKTIMVLTILLLVVVTLMYAVSERDLETLKHSLSLWTLVAFVIIINAISGLTFALLFAAWQWVRCDLKPRRDEDRLDD